ncbi:MAG TPA: DinB family protein [Bacteroidota bacterium]|nr:DinB family protein [Bacteroidota bacterium]
MNRYTLVLFAAALLALAALPLGAQNKPAFIDDFLGQVEYVQGQIMSLEGAVPAEKYSWKPGEGVRSIAEVYRHIEFGNYALLSLMGVQPPADVNFTMDIKKWDAGVTDKSKLASGLKASFDHLKTAAGKMTEADLAGKIDFFGTQMTKRSALMSALSHLHEHLGQSIAYARMNGIVPPWTTEQQAKEAEALKGK